jgi:predicted nucleic acid-binding protein
MVRRVTIDSTVLRSVVDGDLGRVHLEVFRRHDVEVVVPAPALVECTTGKRLRDARMNVVIGGCRVEDTTEQIARRAAALHQRAGLSDAVIDALVVATSELAGGGALLTQRPEVCSPLAAPTSVRILSL